MHNNYPNPFNSSTTIKYEISLQGNVSIDVYNILGQKVKTLIDHALNPGVYSTIWDGKNEYGVHASSGVYIYRLRANNIYITKKMLLLK